MTDPEEAPFDPEDDEVEEISPWDSLEEKRDFEAKIDRLLADIEAAFRARGDRMSFTVLDLFSGIGGFSLAAEWAGGRTIAFAETEVYPAAELKAQWPWVPNLGDVRKLCRRAYDCEPDKDDPEIPWCPRCEEEFGECECIGTDQFTDTYGFPDAITGGVPCQPI